MSSGEFAVRLVMPVQAFSKKVRRVAACNVSFADLSVCSVLCWLQCGEVFPFGHLLESEDKDSPESLDGQAGKQQKAFLEARWKDWKVCVCVCVPRERPF